MPQSELQFCKLSFGYAVCFGHFGKSQTSPILKKTMHTGDKGTGASSGDIINL